MNRLVLIGNGFDLAHGMATSYKAFIKGYIVKCFNSLTDGFFEDRLLKIKKNRVMAFEMWGPFEGCADWLDFVFSNQGLSIANDQYYVGGYIFRLPYDVEVKSAFLDYLIRQCIDAGWVDIEKLYYERLTEIHERSKIVGGNRGGPSENEQLDLLHDEFAHLQSELGKYLNELPPAPFIQGIFEIFNTPLRKRLFALPVSTTFLPEIKFKTHVLDFNYTRTALQYTQKSKLKSYVEDIDHNYIHGECCDAQNPIIFGFGDELDKTYKELEEKQNDRYLRNIKSFHYFRSQAYHNLLRFIDSDEYEVVILGHSCGLSDRTMLNMIFEHPNCKLIRIYYHKSKTGNNYMPLTYEISRQFRDKQALRAKVLPFDLSNHLPQYDD